MSPDRSDSATSLTRIGAVSAILGPVIASLSEALHPLHAHPNDPVAAFAEYATDTLWVWSHLAKFAGFSLIAVALLAVASTFKSPRATALGKIGTLGVIVSLTLAAALQAVDGIALKTMVDRLALTSDAMYAATFEATFAVRQIEIALASVTSLAFGATLIVFGIGQLTCPRYPAWLGYVGILAGLCNVAGGFALASTGFSDMAMLPSMAGSTLALVWSAMIGIHLWRL